MPPRGSRLRTATSTVCTVRLTDGCQSPRGRGIDVTVGPGRGRRSRPPRPGPADRVAGSRPVAPYRACTAEPAQQPAASSSSAAGTVSTGSPARAAITPTSRPRIPAGAASASSTTSWTASTNATGSRRAGPPGDATPSTAVGTDAAPTSRPHPPGARCPAHSRSAPTPPGLSRPGASGFPQRRILDTVRPGPVAARDRTSARRAPGRHHIAPRWS